MLQSLLLFVDIDQAHTAYHYFLSFFASLHVAVADTLNFVKILSLERAKRFS